MEGDHSESGDTDLKHLGRGFEEAEQNMGDQLKCGDTEEHHTGCIENAEFHGFHHAVGFSCAEVIGNHGDHAVVETEDGWKISGITDEKVKTDFEKAISGVISASERGGGSL